MPRDERAVGSIILCIELNASDSGQELRGKLL